MSDRDTGLGHASTSSVRQEAALAVRYFDRALANFSPSSRDSVLTRLDLVKLHRKMAMTPLPGSKLAPAVAALDHYALVLRHLLDTGTAFLEAGVDGKVSSEFLAHLARCSTGGGVPLPSLSTATPPSGGDISSLLKYGDGAIGERRESGDVVLLRGLFVMVWQETHVAFRDVLKSIDICESAGVATNHGPSTELIKSMYRYSLSHESDGPAALVELRKMLKQ